jgi:hypothetical protein
MCTEMWQQGPTKDIPRPDPIRHKRSDNPTTFRQSDNGSDIPTTVPTFRHSDKWTSVVPRTKCVRQSREPDKRPTNARQRPTSDSDVPTNARQRPTISRQSDKASDTPTIPTNRALRDMPATRSRHGATCPRHWPRRCLDAKPRCYLDASLDAGLDTGLDGLDAV